MKVLPYLAAGIGLLVGLGPAASLAQAPPPVPALPDTERRTSYSISGTTCACAVNFSLYGDSTDVDEWIQVYVNGVRKLSTDPTFGWTLSSATGSLGTIPRPITNAVLTFNANQTGTINIVGSRRPRRLTTFAENRGVPARDLNQVLNDVTAMAREAWDLRSRTILAEPGFVFNQLPAASSRASLFLCFDNSGQVTTCSGTGSNSLAAGNGILLGGLSPTTITNNIQAGSGITITGTNPLTISVTGGGNVSGPGTSVNGDLAIWSGAGGNLLADATGISATAGGPLTIAPTTNSTTKGVAITQTGPNTGSAVASEVDYNSVVVTDGLNLGTGNNTSAFTVQHNINTNAVGQKFGMLVQSYRTLGATNMQGDQIAIVPFTQLSKDNGGTNTGAGASGNAFALNPIISALAGATNYNSLVGAEIDRQIFAGATTKYSFGLSVMNAQAGLGASLDAAINIGSSNATGSWKNGILFSQQVVVPAGVDPIQTTTGNLIATDGLGAGHSLNSVITAPDYNFATYFSFANYILSGSGVTTLAENAAPTSPVATLGKFWFDSTDHRLHDRNSSGVIGSTWPTTYTTSAPACTGSGTGAGFACTATLDTVQTGKTVCVTGKFTVSNAGTPNTGNFTVPFPVTPKQNVPILAFGSSTGFLYNWYAGSTQIYKYDGTIPTPVAQDYIVNGCYEAN